MANCSSQTNVRTGFASYASCTRAAKFEFDGKPYCGIHYPPNVEKRHAKIDAEMKEKRERDGAFWELKRASSDVLECADNWADKKPGADAALSAAVKNYRRVGKKLLG